MTRKTNYFNPISIKKLDFSFYELGANDIYQGLQNSREWSITLEITTIAPKEKPRSKEAQMLNALERLNVKIDELNSNVRRLPDKPTHKGKRPATTLYAFVVAMVLLFIGWVNYKNVS